MPCLPCKNRADVAMKCFLKHYIAYEYIPLGDANDKYLSQMSNFLVKELFISCGVLFFLQLVGADKLASL